MSSNDFRRVSRETRAINSIVEIADGLGVGGSEVLIIAGPCAVESEAQIVEVAHALKAAGANLLRGGAFKPRTSPYSFAGLGRDALAFLRKAGDETGMPVVTEVMDVENVPIVEDHADVLQIGSRNMQNYPLLRRVGQCVKPVLLKRGIAATIREWLSSAEYVADSGNGNIILCERGIRSFDPTTRNLFDVTAIPATKRLTHLPVIADPSHGTGDRELVPAMALAAVAAGADAVMIEVHAQPDRALSDGPQSITVDEFRKLVGKLQGVSAAVDRSLVSARDPAPSL